MILDPDPAALIGQAAAARVAELQQTLQRFRREHEAGAPRAAAGFRRPRRARPGSTITATARASGDCPGTAGGRNLWTLHLLLAP
jgi:hypothetical protein